MEDEFMTDITMNSIAEVSCLIAEKKLSPVELTEECIKNLERLNDEYLAYCTPTPDVARAQAKKAENEIMSGGTKSALHGIPIGVKDMFYTKGILTTGGSRFLENFIPDYDATTVARCIDKGAVMMGKTNTHEWAFACNTRSFFGESKNPYDVRRTPGGSSGGSAISVSTGMSFMGLGTDTGGSSRTPAAMCGVVGFKPTYGLTSQYGVIPLSYSLDHIGCLTRSVMDAALTMDIITGFDSNDPCPARFTGPASQFSEQLRHVHDLRGKVFGVPINFFQDKLDYEVERLYNESLRKLQDLGAELRYIEIPYVEEFPPMAARIMFADAAHYHRERMAENIEGFGPIEQARFRQGAALSAVDLIDAMQVRERVKRAFAESVKDIDFVVVATNPVTAPFIGATTTPCQDKMEPTGEIVVRHTRLGTFAGIPALSIPMGITKAGMPSGLMIMSGVGRDIEVLTAGWALEQNYPFLFRKF